MTGKIIRIIWWILFTPVGMYLTYKHRQRERAKLEAQRHQELVNASR